MLPTLFADCTLVETLPINITPSSYAARSLHGGNFSPIPNSGGDPSLAVLAWDGINPGVCHSEQLYCEESPRC